jgi:transposase
MARPLLPDELWEVIEPLLPNWTPSPKGGQPPVPDRAALTGILFVLKSGIPWEDLPCEMNCGCGMTCWRRLRDWQAAGVWDKIHKVLLDKPRGADKIDWSRALVDSSSVRAAYGGQGTGPSPVDRGKPGTKHHLITDAGGIPLASRVTAANVNDVTQLAPLFNKIPPVAGRVGRPRRKPDAAHGDLAYDSEPHRGSAPRCFDVARLLSPRGPRTVAFGPRAPVDAPRRPEKAGTRPGRSSPPPETPERLAARQRGSRMARLPQQGPHARCRAAAARCGRRVGTVGGGTFSRKAVWGRAAHFDGLAVGFRSKLEPRPGHRTTQRRGGPAGPAAAGGSPGLRNRSRGPVEQSRCRSLRPDPGRSSSDDRRRPRGCAGSRSGPRLR